ncbi:ShlB/FhaC/HecB family hemolysin secretion/activation protein [Sphingomonas japonica]|uniref:Hemolysin activation/secretion protein n=1 Tax=Sphingomonas japonica TaxID=511662 RepID=A0ABX0U5T3_9SPHN|nr:ShlB/FhaC/HecB family hemolysin secretion/activation protein [Sphingomonas japonica]NIJ24612.1 hemolysin activation/secretion protein [Sphingomonas japonica]
MVKFSVAAAVLLTMAAPSWSQEVLDRTDPSVQERSVPSPDLPTPDPKPPITVEAPSGTSAATTTAVAVGAVTLVGLDRLTPADFTDIIADHVGRTLPGDELARLATRIAQRARARGLVFASAWIAPQRMTAGVLVVHIDEGRIDRIRIEGDQNAAVAATLAPLANGRAPTLDEVERRLLIAGDIEGIYVRRSRFVRDANSGVLVVDVDASRVVARAVLENDGSAPIGPEKLQLDVAANALLFSDDTLAVTYVTTPFEPEELQYGRVRYAKRMTDQGTELGVVASISSTAPGAYLTDREIEGQSWSTGISLLQPIWRRRTASLWFDAEFAVRNLRQSRRDIRVREDRVTTFRAGLSGNALAAGGRLRINATVTRGLDGLGASRAGDPMRSRDDADGTFTALYVWTDWIRDLGSDFSTRLAARGQISSDPLLLSEEIGLGGTGFLRAYDYNERSGDEGAMASAELRYDIAKPLGIARRAQLFAYLDGGRVTNLGPDGNSGSLASGGGGIRSYVTRGLNVELEVAVPMAGDRFDSGQADPQINFRIAKSF